MSVRMWKPFVALCKRVRTKFRVSEESTCLWEDVHWYALILRVPPPPQVPFQKCSLFILFNKSRQISITMAVGGWQWDSCVASALVMTQLTFVSLKHTNICTPGRPLKSDICCMFSHGLSKVLLTRTLAGHLFCLFYIKLSNQALGRQDQIYILPIHSMRALGVLLEFDFATFIWIFNEKNV